MAKHASSRSRPDRLAALHRQGEEWRVVILRGAGDAPSVESAASVPAQGEALAQHLRRAKVDVGVMVIPASACVTRTVPAAPPTGSPAQVHAALELLAESQFGSAQPSCRRAAGVVRPGGGESIASVLAVAWSGPAQTPELGEKFDLRFVPAPAALASLARWAGGCPWALATDRSNDALLLAVAGPTQTQVRGLLDDGSDERAWASAVHESLASAARAAGLPEPELPALPDAAVRLAPGAKLPAQAQADAAWLDRFGLALGAGALVLGGDASSAPLAELLPAPPVPKRMLLLKAVDRLCEPRTAWSVIAASVALLLLGPLAFSAARYHLLARQTAGGDENQADTTLARQQAEFYQLLREKRWPMSKLLGDIASSMPAGITLDSLTLEVGQRLRITGTAESQPQVTEWKTTIEKLRVFDEVRSPIVDTSSQPVRFELSVRVAQPLLSVGVAAGAKPAPGGTAPPAGGAATPAPAPAAEPAPPPPSEDGTPRGDRAKGPANRTDRGDKAGKAPATKGGKAEIPPPLTDEAIAAMSRSDAIREFGKRRGAMSQPGVSDEVRQRLNDEAEKLRQRMQQAAGGGQ
jgi:hypothetical protein